VQIATIYVNNGSIYYKIKDYEMSIASYKKSIAMYRKSFGDKHPYIAVAFKGIGKVHEKKGDFKTSLIYYDKALQSLVYGKEVENVWLDLDLNKVNSLNDLSEVLTSQAEVLFLKWHSENSK